MAKRAKTSQSAEEKALRATLREVEAPAGFEVRSGDLVGFYRGLEEDAIMFTPEHAKAFDSTIEPVKPMVLIVAKLTAPAALVTQDGEIVQGKSGDQFGIWAKPGMRALLTLKGAECWMAYVGEQETGKPNPMRVYKIASKGAGSTLYTIEDKRKQSKGAELMFPVLGSTERF